jgi:hypothetical protein
VGDRTCTVEDLVLRRTDAMQWEANHDRSASAPGRQRDYWFFLGYVAAFAGAGAAIFLGMLYGLRATGSLPAPPLTGTYCIDEKFKFLAEHDLEETDLLAVGSSVTWRNLDLTPFVEGGLSSHPVNAAPCYLRMHQTAFLTEFLLAHLPDVRNVVTVVAPRDFDYCSEAERAFFSSAQAGPYVFHGASPVWIYAANFRPLQLIRDAMQVRERRSNPKSPEPLVMGPYGSGPIQGTRDWNPLPPLDDKCFAALTGLEERLASRGVKLTLVSFPLSPGWRSRHDSSGDFQRTYESRLRASLKHDETTFMSSRSFSSDPSLYFDAVHFQWPAARVFSARVAALAQSVR